MALRLNLRDSLEMAIRMRTRNEIGKVQIERRWSVVRIQYHWSIFCSCSIRSKIGSTHKLGRPVQKCNMVSQQVQGDEDEDEEEVVDTK